MENYITIISPIRNEEQHISKCLFSLVDQDFDSSMYEIIVVDGMSTDNTRNIVNEYVNRYDNIFLHDNHNRTAPYAMNIGLKYAKGNIIIRVDGHATIEKDYLKQCVYHLQNIEAECVGGVIESVNETYLGKAIAFAMSSQFGVGNVRFRTSGEEGFVDGLAFGAYRREVFDKIGVFDEELTRNQDDEFNYRLRKFGGKIFFTPKIKSYYYPRSSLKKLWRQYYQYGFWKIRVLQKHKRMMQARQFVPPIFVASLIATGITGLFIKEIIWGFLLVSCMYIVANISASILLSCKKGMKYFFSLPLIFFILHVGYGLGFITGIFKFAKYWKSEGGN